MKIGLIGYGYWGEKIYRNLLNFYSESDLYVCDIYKNNDTTQISNFYSTYKEDFLTQIDALIICTPVNSHFQIAKIALQNNKHVLIEKPATSTVQELLELQKIANENNLILAIDHTFLYASEILKMYELLSNPDFGNLKHFISTRTIFGKFTRDVNAIWDLAVHDFSILYLFKNQLPVSVIVTSIKNEEELIHTAFISLKYKDGFFAHITCSWDYPTKERKIIVTGTNKQLLSEGNNLQLFVNENEVNKSEINSMNQRQNISEIIHFEQNETLSVMLSDFFESIKTIKQPVSNAESAIFVLKILEACDLSVQNDGKEIFLS